MSVKLFFQALTKFSVFVLIMGLLLFVPAGSFNYWSGWLFMALTSIPTAIIGIMLMIKNPKLLKKGWT